MELALGIIIGMIGAVLLIVFGQRNETHITKLLKKIGDTIELPKEKVEFLDPGSSEEDALEILYEEHKKKGIDMKL